MRVLHWSDNHQRFLNLDEHLRFDMIVSSGDFFPDFGYRPMGNKEMEIKHQIYWLEENAHQLKLMVGNKPYLFVPGNHDGPSGEIIEKILRGHEINAYNLVDKIVSIDNVNFYGFPYVPYINGEFFNELTNEEMSVKSAELAEKLNETYVDVIVAHAPLYGILDKYVNFSYGNKILLNHLVYSVSKDLIPQYYLHGHIHSAHGIEYNYKLNMLFSNAATTYNILSI